MLDNLTIYWGLAINGFCTGLGVIFAQTIFEMVIKKRLNKWHKNLVKRKRVIA